MGTLNIPRFLFLLSFVMAILFSVALADAEDLKLKVTATRANVRSQPSVNSTVIIVLSAGTILDSVGKEGNWHKIKLPAATQTAPAYGYIHQSIVEVVEEPKEIPQKEGIIEKKPPETVIQKEEKEEAKLPPKVPIRPKPERKRGRIGLKLTAGYPLPSNDFFSGSFSVEGGIWLGITNNVAVELTGEMFSYSSLGESDCLSEGSLSTAAVSLNIQGRLFLDKRLVPFIMAGGSYYLNKFSLASEIVGSWDDIGLTITEKCKNSLAFFGGAGLDFFIANNIALTGDIKYVISTAKGTWSLADQVTDTSVSGDIESIKLGAFVIKAGIRFLF